MTTPGQSLPPTLETLLGIGAFQIGGGSTNFGQGINEAFVRNLIAGAGTAIWTGIENVGQIIDNIAAWLATLPLEALKMFQHFIPGSVPDQFIDIATAVQTIVSALSVQKLLLSLDVFEDFILNTFNLLGTIVSQIISIIKGDPVTPITEDVQFVKTWFANFRAVFEGIDWSDPFLDPANAITWLQNEIIQPLLDVFGLGGITELGSYLYDTLTELGGGLGSIVASFSDLLNNLVDGLTGTTGSTLQTPEGVLTAAQTLFTNFGNLSTNFNLLLNYLYDAFTGAVGSTGKTLSNVLSAAQTFYTGAAGAATKIATLISDLGGSVIGDVSAIIGSLVTGVADILNTLWNIFTGNTGATGKTLANVAAAGSSFFTGAADGATKFAALLSATGEATATSLGNLINLLVTMLNQIADIFDGGVVTPVNTAVQQINDWWASNLAYLENIPNTAVQGLAGFGTNIGNSVTALSDGVWQGLRAFLGIPSGVGPPQVSSAAQQVRVDLNNATDIASGAAAFQAKQAISKQSYLSIDPSADPVFPLAQINGASPSTVSVTQTKSVMGIIGLPDNGLKKSLVWLGGSLANITGVYVNLYKVNTTTGVFTRTHQSSNIIGDLTSPVSGVAWQFYNLPMTAFFPTLQGEWYVAEIVVVGSGTYSIVGISNSWMPSHPSVYPKALGAARTGLPSTLYSAIGAAASGSNTTTVNETITLNSGDNAVYVAVILFSDTSALTSVSATLGGVAMTLKSLSTDFLSSSAFEYLAVFELIGTAGSGAFTTGSKTIAVTEAGLTGTFGMAVRAASFKNVASSGAAQTATGTNASPAQTVTGLTKDQLVFQAFAAASAAAGQSMSGYNQEQIANIASATGVSDCLLLGDAFAGVSTSVAFSATAPASGWRGIAVPITLSASPFAPPSSISSPTYDAATPWLALAGAAGRAQHPPETVEFETAGTFTYNVPSWVEDGDYIDVVPCGAGAGGSYQGGIVASPPVNTYDSTSYKGGGAGSWNPVRLRYGDAYDIPTGTTTFTVNVGAGGAGGAYPGTSYAPVHASDGANTTVVITGYPTITANGGTKDTSAAASTMWGDTPGNTVFQGVTYFGGTVATLGSFGAGGPPVTPGNGPGGGGAAGLTRRQGGYAYDVSGGAGAPGACYITAVQSI
ncbi:hypothetical protein [Mycobacterium paragordonae]|uniref:Glycine-rich domain-containing protein n=1 Tax=Mycobacterium paragordonae TaxID=1389713 RepID=A0AAJ1S0M7_9MYCO|nr:hypothetical protein [Mycobacterium paragordonae]MDP7733632.1 hypothetical protein [Mycobacterium paragordonae]